MAAAVQHAGAVTLHQSNSTDAVDDGQLKRLAKLFNADAAEQANRQRMEAGLRVCQTLIFDTHAETAASIQATCRALRGMNPTAVVATTSVRLYPGTPLAESLIAAGSVQLPLAA